MSVIKVILDRHKIFVYIMLKIALLFIHLDEMTLTLAVAKCDQNVY